MKTPAQVRRIRLANDYTAMQNIARDWLRWEGTRGTTPYFDAYRLTLRVRTIISPEPTYRSDHVVEITVPASYPDEVPLARMVTTPYPFHPNWFVDGRWCSGQRVREEGLAEFVIRLIQTLQYNVYITNENSAANHQANSWYLQRKSQGLFPCDRTPLPDPSTGRLRIVTLERPRFAIKPQ